MAKKKKPTGLTEIPEHLETAAQIWREIANSASVGEVSDEEDEDEDEDEEDEQGNANDSDVREVKAGGSQGDLAEDVARSYIASRPGNKGKATVHESGKRPRLKAGDLFDLVKSTHDPEVRARTEEDRGYRLVFMTQLSKKSREIRDLHGQVDHLRTQLDSALRENDRLRGEMRMAEMMNQMRTYLQGSAHATMPEFPGPAVAPSTPFEMFSAQERARTRLAMTQNHGQAREHDGKRPHAVSTGAETLQCRSPSVEVEGGRETEKRMDGGSNGVVQRKRPWEQE
jgi:hypothetical protein